MATSTMANPNEVTYVNPSKLDASVWTGGSIALRKCNGIIQVKLEGVVFAAITERRAFAQCPEGYRPLTESYFKDNSGITILISADGVMKTETSSARTTWGTGMFIAG